MFIAVEARRHLLDLIAQLIGEAFASPLDRIQGQLFCVGDPLKLVLLIADCRS